MVDQDETDEQRWQQQQHAAPDELLSVRRDDQQRRDAEDDRERAVRDARRAGRGGDRREAAAVAGEHEPERQYACDHGEREQPPVQLLGRPQRREHQGEQRVVDDRVVASPDRQRVHVRLEEEAGEAGHERGQEDGDRRPLARLRLALQQEPQ